MKTIIVKKWNHAPEVKLEIDKEGQSVEIAHNDYLKALSLALEQTFHLTLVPEIRETLIAKLIKEVGSVTYVFTAKTFEEKVSLAVEKVLPGLIEDALQRTLWNKMQERDAEVIQELKKQSIHNFTK